MRPVRVLARLVEFVAPAVEHLVASGRDFAGTVGRIEDDVVLLDLRTVPQSFDNDLAALISTL